MQKAFCRGASQPRVTVAHRVPHRATAFQVANTELTAKSLAPTLEGIDVVRKFRYCSDSDGSLV
jgi:hypothetical protein